MKKILLIIPYFGPFPNYFELWLKSARANKTIDFLLITDNKIENIKDDNIKIIKTNFEDVKTKIQSIFNFKIIIDTPYELCKYKPAYGIIFKEYIANYDFWGYCDIDLIFGDIRKFITDDILSRYEKILSHGHFSLYKNCDKINKLFMTKRKDCMYYKDVFSSKISWNNFDEYPYGVSRIAKMENIKVFEKMIFADLDMFTYTFRKLTSYYETEQDDKEDIIQYFKWEDGKLLNIIYNNDNIQENELMYVHFQKRKMEISSEENLENRYVIVPNEFLSDKLSQKDIIKFCDISKNNEYNSEKINEILRKKDNTPLIKKIFSIDRIKRKIFLIKMKKIYKVYPYTFEKGGF